jgi:hypothetical protein
MLRFIPRFVANPANPSPIKAGVFIRTSLIIMLKKESSALKKLAD